MNYAQAIDAFADLIRVAAINARAAMAVAFLADVEGGRGQNRGERPGRYMRANFVKNSKVWAPLQYPARP
jgi:hypothetical protein